MPTLAVLSISVFSNLALIKAFNLIISHRWLYSFMTTLPCVPPDTISQYEDIATLDDTNLRFMHKTWKSTNYATLCQANQPSCQIE